MYDFLGLTKRFSAWIDTYIKEDNDYEFQYDIDFTSVLSSTVVNNGANRELQDYALTISMAKELSMLSKSSKGKEARKYFIACEEKLKKIVKPALPSYTEALRQLADSIDENEELKDEKKKLEEEGKQLVSARELHEFLAIKQDFSTWVKARINKYRLSKIKTLRPINLWRVSFGE